MKSNFVKKCCVVKQALGGFSTSQEVSAHTCKAPARSKGTQSNSSLAMPAECCIAEHADFEHSDAYRRRRPAIGLNDVMMTSLRI